MDNSIEETGAKESPVLQRALMPDWLFRETVIGNKQIWESENGEVDRADHLQLSIEALDAGPSRETKKAEALAYLQSASYMGNTVLHILASYGHTELANVICQKDRTMWRAQNKMIETPFHCAAKAGHENTISALIEFAREDGEAQLKAVLRGRNKRGETALHEAAKRGHAGVVFKLMEVDLLLAFECNNDGLSPWNLAAARGTKYYDKVAKNDMVAKMLEQLTSINIDSAHSSSALESEVTVHVGVEIKMPQSNVKISENMPIHLLAGAGQVGMVRFLLENDISLAYVRNSDGLFPVHQAAQEGNGRMVRLLMKMCPDSGELLDHRGRNFLHVAAENNYSDRLGGIFFQKKDIFIIEMFNTTLKDNFMHEMFNTMLNETDNEGNTPFHLVRASKEHQSFSMFNRFYEQSLRVKLRNKKGLTPMEISEQPASSDEKMQKIQLIGLGGVLITTVAFAVAFAPPGGYDQIKGSPLLADKYIFKAFILADTLAFALSVWSVAASIYFGFKERGLKSFVIKYPLYVFSTAVKCMVLAFGLGLYLMLAPVIKSVGILILVVTLLTVMQDQVVVVITRNSTEIVDIVNTPQMMFLISILFIFLFALLK